MTNADDLFVSEQAVEHVITVGSKSLPLFFREIPDVDWRTWMVMSRSNDLTVEAGARAFLISKALCNPNGTPAMTHEQACRLKLQYARAIEAKILELNKQAEGNASPPGVTIGSGTS